VNAPLLIGTLTEHLRDVRLRLDDRRSRRLDVLLEEIRDSDGDPDHLEEIAIEVADLVEPILPAGHPVRRVITTRPRFDSSPAEPDPADWAPVLSRIREINLASGFASAAELLADVRANLLTAHSYRPDEVLDGHDPHLVRLEEADGTGRVPAFQFDASGLARPIVLLINRLLEAGDDPWGVADWWLGGNAWLGAAPADLLGGGRDDDLVAAAQAELEGI
jgi:hypothetical protein